LVYTIKVDIGKTEVLEIYIPGGESPPSGRKIWTWIRSKQRAKKEVYSQKDNHHMPFNRKSIIVSISLTPSG